MAGLLPRGNPDFGHLRQTFDSFSICNFIIYVFYILLQLSLCNDEDESGVFSEIPECMSF